jgi:hypothetical protein
VVKLVMAGVSEMIMPEVCVAGGMETMMGGGAGAWTKGVEVVIAITAE